MANPKDSRSSGSVTAADRRGFSRRSSHVSALLRSTDQATGTAVRVDVVDFSYGGACFVAPLKLDVDEHVLLDMPSSSAGSGTMTFEAIVRWVEGDEASSGFRTGCAWIRQLSYLELRQLR